MKKSSLNIITVLAACAFAGCASTPPPAPKNLTVAERIPQGYIIGADISSVQAAEVRTHYSDKGEQKDILAILKDHGFNYIRLRIFVNPASPGGYSPGQGYCDLDHTILMGKRIKAAGLGFLLDFHYSDTWADPGKQTKPLAWRDLALPDLVKTVHDYTKDVVTKLKAAGAGPDMVQIGNEITPGMLLNRLPAARGGQAQVVSTQPEGSTKDWDTLSALLKAGISGAKDADPNILTMLHIDKGGSTSATVAWVDNAMSHGVKFDILGESCYTTYQGSPDLQKANFEALVKRYPNLYFINDEYGGGTRNANNDLVKSGTLVMKNPYPGQYAGLDWTMRMANDTMYNLPDKKGLGTFIWEPTQNINQEMLFTPSPTDRNLYVANTLMYMYDQMAKDYADRKPRP